MRSRLLALTLAATAAASAARAGALAVPLNHSVRLPLAGPAQSVVVGSPSVIDVAVVDSHTIYVSGKTLGETDVTVIDPLGRVVFHGDVAVGLRGATAGGSLPVNVYRGSTHSLAVCGVTCLEAPLERPADGGGSAGPATASAATRPGAPSPMAPGQVVSTVSSAARPTI